MISWLLFVLALALVPIDGAKDRDWQRRMIERYRRLDMNDELTKEERKKWIREFTAGITDGDSAEEKPTKKDVYKIMKSLRDTRKDDDRGDNDVVDQRIDDRQADEVVANTAVPSAGERGEEHDSATESEELELGVLTGGLSNKTEQLDQRRAAERSKQENCNAQYMQCLQRKFGWASSLMTGAQKVMSTVGNLLGPINRV